ncbi:zinc-binding dehydrogenase [Georgenia sp. AZ-5]|uniref:zinc-binding dehydrogenase n=1 Tax=Georgenia sp. AZ-5 TaxID=3367526 RepID=UPI0037546FF5
MKAVLLPGERRVDIVERDVPVPGEDEVLVKTRASAICRSDMGLYTGTSAIVGGEAAGKGLIVPGHEPAGMIADVGPAVEGMAIGDRVAAYLPIGCGRCEYCRAGYMMLCTTWRCLGFDVDGGDADYFVVPAANALPLPDEMSFVAGAVMTDMVGSQYHTQKVLGVRGGRTIAVFGLGPMGAAAVLVAKGFGADVIAVDILPERLELARRLGADTTVNPAETDPVAAVRDATGGRGADVAVDCTGAPPAQNAALDSAAKRGAVAFVGESRATQINPSDQIIRKLLTVVGGWYFPLYEWNEITRFVLSRRVPVEQLVTHTFPLDDAENAFAMFDRRETEKAVFVWPDGA